jgi:arabinose-5-phosphate isomerase
MDYVAKARTVIALEIEELSRLGERIGPAFCQAVDALRRVIEDQRKIIVCGVGKSGNIAHKIAATLNSTGATAVVLNSQDALHGDLGLVNAGDAVILLSYSGETDEILNLLPHLKRQDVRIIAITGGLDSTLAKHADVVLDARVQREACPLNLAPTSSSTVTLVLGDALAMVLLEARGFEAEDFARLHPGGSLGRALLTKVGDVMRTADRLALCPQDGTVLNALQAMTRCKAGAAVIAAADGTLAGIFTQGDFVRAYQEMPDVATLPVAQFMSRRPVTIREDRLAGELLQLLERHSVDEVIVLDAASRPVGVVDTQDLSRFKLL